MRLGVQERVIVEHVDRLGLGDLVMLRVGGVVVRDSTVRFFRGLV